MKRIITVEELSTVVEAVESPADLILVLEELGFSAGFVEPLVTLWCKRYDETSNFEKMRWLEQSKITRDKGYEL